jgi:GNAT superfamily N-acetyltransferase
MIGDTVLTLYDTHERYQATAPGLRREALPNLVRQVDLVGSSGVVLYSRLSADTVDAAIEDQLAYFQSIGQGFEWKAYSHDQPRDLVQRLAAHGFSIDEQEAILVLDLQSPVALDLAVAAPRASADPLRSAATPAEFELSVRIRRLMHRDELRDVATIRQRVGRDDSTDLVNYLANELIEIPGYLSVYVADVDGAPAACAWIRFPGESPFASLWGGSTVPEMRNHGLYTALLTARVDEARARNYRYVTVDAGHMSRPILEKRGFRLLTYATACTVHG